ncbi:hypothetical protein E1B28_008274 [Marasmius oreades]|uniref:F-box domain-containing protein n=1 Tax=Marasmius oreades TaxID=181124 RepID=A0A9P7RZL5_9AGAR|nr:uncharacterized protein E1B28_008274 [Marasmius oreades]KAG7091873.1 hypothetical protein E1B28_008274 [Marasmius oreades]
MRTELSHSLWYAVVDARSSIICSTPSLWAYIGLDVERWYYHWADDSAATDGITRLTDGVQLFLDRSKSAPLNLDLTIKMRSSVPVGPTTKLLDVLAQSMTRWRVVFLNISPEIFEHPALQLLPQSLQHVTWTDPSSDLHVNLFNKCPSLTSLNLFHIQIPYRFQRESPRIKTLDITLDASSATLIPGATGFLDELFVGQSCSLSSPLLPHLTDLNLFMNRDSFKEEPLVRAVTSRWLPNLEDATKAGVACLRSFRLMMMNHDFVPTLEPLLYLRDAGLRVDVFPTLELD